MCFPLAIMTQSPCSNLVLNRDFYLYTREKFFQDLCWGGTLQGLECYQYKEINMGKTAAKCQDLPGSPSDSFASLCPMRSYDFSPTHTTLTSGFLISLPVSAYVSAEASFQCSDPRLSVTSVVFIFDTLISVCVVKPRELSQPEFLDRFHKTLELQDRYFLLKFLNVLCSLHYKT